MHERRPTQAGFTLIELMVVVVIIAIISTVLFGVSSRTYGANAKNVADQLAGILNNARIRAIATRRITHVYVQPSQLQVWADDRTGLMEGSGTDLFVEKLEIPHGVTVFDVDSVVSAGSGSSATENTSLSYELKFKPDGTSTGGTLFVRDNELHDYRVIVYRATGSVYARQYW